MVNATTRKIDSTDLPALKQSSRINSFGHESFNYIILEAL